MSSRGEDLDRARAGAGVVQRDGQDVLVDVVAIDAVRDGLHPGSLPDRGAEDH